MEGLIGKGISYISAVDESLDICPLRYTKFVYLDDHSPCNKVDVLHSPSS
jgi:hypothetical protein